MLTAAILAFLSCSFLGWLLEVFWLSFHGEKAIKGVFYPFPLKPIYGFGGVGIVLAGPYLSNMHLLFQWLLLSVFLGGFEALGGYCAERFYKRKLWRYKGWLNIHGHTDAFHAAVWGLIALGILHLL